MKNKTKSSLYNVIKFLEAQFKWMDREDIALNGLQIENSGNIRKIISAVDFSNALLDACPGEKTLFIVHHGIFWGKPLPLTDSVYTMLKKMVERDSALIAIHLPLDIHPRWGNNVLLARQLGLKKIQTFGHYKGYKILLKGEINLGMRWDAFVDRFKKKVGKPLCSLPFGPSEIKKVGLCTGGGLFGIREASQEGCDTYVTGDANHTIYHLCRDEGVNLICGGHYQTEVFGIQCLGKVLSKKFGLPHDFASLPTGL